jgi:hypothetical protein
MPDQPINFMMSKKVSNWSRLLVANSSFSIKMTSADSVYFNETLPIIKHGLPLNSLAIKLSTTTAGDLKAFWFANLGGRASQTNVSERRCKT